MVHRLSCSMACGIFLGLGLNLCLLHWQVDSLPQSHQTVVAPRKPPVPPRKPLGGALDDLLTLILRAYPQKFRK